MKKILILLSLSVAFFAIQPLTAQPKLLVEHEDDRVNIVDLKSFEKENMVEIIPNGKKVILEDFSGKIGPQTIFGYAIAKYEVTQELFFTVMGFNPSRFSEHGAKNPVECVTWYDAVFFCNELTKKTMSEEDCSYTITNIQKNEKGNIISANVTRSDTKKGYRLPTEAEWEMAARGGVNGGWELTYSGSNHIDEVTWYFDNSNSTTHKVGTKHPNSAGLYDMSGNVWEWCEDLINPSYRADRGGSWDGDNCAVHSRDDYTPYHADRSLGFRVCKSL